MENAFYEKAVHIRQHFLHENKHTFSFHFPWIFHVPCILKFSKGWGGNWRHFSKDNLARAPQNINIYILWPTDSRHITETYHWVSAGSLVSSEKLLSYSFQVQQRVETATAAMHREMSTQWQSTTWILKAHQHISFFFFFFALFKQTWKEF